MEFDESKIKRANILIKKIRNCMGNNNVTIQNIADKLWVSHAYISQNMNWRKIPTDELFKKIMNAVWMASTEIKKIFQEADKEEYKYKYWEDLDLWEKEIDFKIAFKKEYWKELTENDKAILDRIFKEHGV